MAAAQMPQGLPKTDSLQILQRAALSNRGVHLQDQNATDLGWESLCSRRWSKRLTLFYKFVNNLSPEYTIDPVPPLHQSQYCLRNQDVIGRLNARTEKSKSSFYPNCLSAWKKLEPDLRLAPSVAIFKKKLLSKICTPPPAKSVFGIHDPKGLSYLNQLRVGLSKLNFQKFKHNFRDTINQMCPTNDGIEDTEHCLLLCPSFDAQRRDLGPSLSK